MRTVSMRQFQRNFYTELKNIPFIVTKFTWIPTPVGKRSGVKVRKEVPEIIVVAYDPDSPILNTVQEQSTTNTQIPYEQNTPPTANPQEVKESKGIFGKLFGK